jgi:hypothetical protein
MLNGIALAQPGEELGPPPSEGEFETLLQGPIHEAFARPVNVDPNAGIITAKTPPEPIVETPPEVKPAGEDVIWIPGYWAWDVDREDFIWISGVWRSPPPDQRWVPGYWMETSDGYQWIAGFWVPIEAEQVEYLPDPPASLEQGPTSPQPSHEHYWVTGCWILRDSEYAWRPGYWTSYYEGWVWIPAHYVWTPRGCVFIDGYWDYAVAQRGQIFAPVYFQPNIYARQHFTYTPRVSITLTNVLVHLFVNPRHHHYYCGNYYDDQYRNTGYYAWSDYYGQSRNYDPLFSYYSTYYRTRGIDYAQRLQGWHAYYRQNAAFRPPRTLTEQIRITSRAQDNENLRYSLLGASVNDLLTQPNSQTRYERVAVQQRQSLMQVATQVRQMTQLRVESESNPATALANNRNRSDQTDRERPRGSLRLPDVSSLTEQRARTETRSTNIDSNGDPATSMPSNELPESSESDERNSGERPQPPDHPRVTRDGQLENRDEASEKPSTNRNERIERRKTPPRPDRPSPDNDRPDNEQARGNERSRTQSSSPRLSPSVPNEDDSAETGANAFSPNQPGNSPTRTIGPQERVQGGKSLPALERERFQEQRSLRPSLPDANREGPQVRGGAIKPPVNDPSIPRNRNEAPELTPNPRSEDINGGLNNRSLPNRGSIPPVDNPRQFTDRSEGRAPSGSPRDFNRGNVDQSPLPQSQRTRLSQEQLSPGGVSSPIPQRNRNDLRQLNQQPQGDVLNRAQPRGQSFTRPPSRSNELQSSPRNSNRPQSPGRGQQSDEKPPRREKSEKAKG